MRPIKTNEIEQTETKVDRCIFWGQSINLAQSWTSNQASLKTVTPEVQQTEELGSQIIDDLARNKSIKSAWLSRLKSAQSTINAQFLFTFVNSLFSQHAKSHLKWVISFLLKDEIQYDQSFEFSWF